MMFGCGVCQICQKLRHFPVKNVQFGYASLARQQLKVYIDLDALWSRAYKLAMFN